MLDSLKDDVSSASRDSAIHKTKPVNHYVQILDKVYSTSTLVTRSITPALIKSHCRFSKICKFWFHANQSKVS